MSEFAIKNNQNATKLSNQLKNSSKQYPPLTKDEEKALIEKYKDDRDSLNRLLIMHNIRRVYNMAKSYASKTDDFDSLIQNGMVGLAVAAKRFDPGRDVKFCTYASRWIMKYMTMAYYSPQFKIDSNTVSMNSPALDDETDGSVSPDETFENSINKYIDLSVGSPSMHDVGAEISSDEQSEICGELYSAMDSDSSLSAIDKAVFKKLFIDCEKTRDVAIEYKMDVSDVSKIKRRVLAKFKDILVDRHNITSYSDIA